MFGMALRGYLRKLQPLTEGARRSRALRRGREGFRSASTPLGCPARQEEHPVQQRRAADQRARFGAQQKARLRSTPAGMTLSA
jgi:hypothetical protein